MSSAGNAARVEQCSRTSLAQIGSSGARLDREPDGRIVSKVERISPSIQIF